MVESRTSWVSWVGKWGVGLEELEALGYLWAEKLGELGCEKLRELWCGKLG